MSRKKIAILLDYFDTEYAQGLYNGACNYLKDTDYDVLTFVIGTINAPESANQYQQLAVASLVNSSTVDGIVFIATSQFMNVSYEYIRSYLKSFAPLPVVTIGCHFDEFPSVMHTCKKSMAELVSHLIEKHDCKRFALVTFGGYSEEAEERENVFYDTLESHGISRLNVEEFYGAFNYETAYTELSYYYKRNERFDFDAIVALNDEMAFACLEFADAHGFRVPEDFIVTGFDDEARSSCTSPTLTSINQNLDIQSIKALRVLEDIIEGRNHDMHFTVDSHPVFRGSCGCSDDTDSSLKKYSSTLQGFKQWYANRNQFQKMVIHFSTMEHELTLEELKKRINADLFNFGLKNAAVCLFKEPRHTEPFEFFALPKEMIVFSAFDKESNYIMKYSEKPLYFDPKKCILPKEVDFKMHGDCIVSIYRNSWLYGYIVFKPGNFDPLVYSMLCKLINMNIANSSVFSISQKEKKTLEYEYKEICTISLTDELTGLLNRRGFLSLGTKTLEAASSRGQNGLLLFGDIDGLKKINDTYGHAAGDRAIIAEAEILKNVFGSADIIGRLGGDEFAIIAPDGCNVKIDDVRKKVEDKCREYNRTSGEQFTLSISLGVVEYGAKPEDYDVFNLLEIADSYLYEEKKLKHSKEKK